MQERARSELGVWVGGVRWGERWVLKDKRGTYWGGAWGAFGGGWRGWRAWGLGWLGGCWIVVVVVVGVGRRVGLRLG